MIRANITLAGKSIIDAGCHSGRWFPWFIEHGVKKVVGIDHRLYLLPQKDGLPKNVSVLNANLDEEYPKVHADIFLGLGILYHLMNPFRFLLWARTCSNIGIIETAVNGRDDYSLTLTQEDIEDTMGSYKYALIPSEKALFEMARIAGWEPIRACRMSELEPDGKERMLLMLKGAH